MELQILDQEKRDFSACLNIDGLLAECSRESVQEPSTYLHYISFCCLDDPYRNPNMNNKDHRVGILTR